MIEFSDTTNNDGILQQARDLMLVDSTQYPTQRVVNSCNNWLDTITGYAVGADRRFQWDDTNHTKMPIGTTNVVANQAEYSFLVDEQGNSILNITRIDIKDSQGNWTELKSKDMTEIVGALDEFESTPGIPKYYDKVADNIIKLYPTPSANVTAGLKFYFQRTGSYFTASDTTKSPGVSPLLHRGFVIAAAYDGALALGLNNLNALENEQAKELSKMVKYFADRNPDEKKRLTPAYQSNK